MIIEIDTLKAVVFGSGCLAAYVVYKHNKAAHPGPTPAGDLGAAIAAGLAVILAFAFLFNLDQAGTDSQNTPTPATTSTLDPAGQLDHHPPQTSPPPPPPQDNR